MDSAPGGARTLFAGGGHMYAFNNIGTTPVRVVNGSQQRSRVTFHNPGSVDLYAFPSVVQNNGTAPLPAGSPGSDTPNTPSLAALGGCFQVYAFGGVLIVDGPAAGLEWQVFAKSGTTNPLTVMNSNRSW